jgi:hypothetical protein
VGPHAPVHRHHHDFWDVPGAPFPATFLSRRGSQPQLRDSSARAHCRPLGLCNWDWVVTIRSVSAFCVSVVALYVSLTCHADVLMLIFMFWCFGACTGGCAWQCCELCLLCGFCSFSCYFGLDYVALLWIGLCVSLCLFNGKSMLASIMDLWVTIRGIWFPVRNSLMCRFRGCLQHGVHNTAQLHMLATSFRLALPKP